MAEIVLQAGKCWLSGVSSKGRSSGTGRQEQAWITCTFEPLEGWKGVRPLFDVQNQAAKERFPADKVWATKEIRDRGVELRPPKSGAGPVIEPFMIYVDGDRARFRL
ncbi:hypothetical protein [Streptomyces virginiae]|uniref:hypothetical protein n=1 Tax=Streptomyces virginiae TaxID=1961 RepID=UPI00324413BB